MITELRDALRRMAKTTRLKSGPIVLIDDSNDDQIIIGREVKFLFGDSPIHAFRNGAEFLKYLRTCDTRDGSKERPRIILLDLHMPEMNGFDTLSMLRASAKYKDIPVIIISGTQDSRDMTEAYERGATAFLPKPTSKEDRVLWQQCINTHASL